MQVSLVLIGYFPADSYVAGGVGGISSTCWTICLLGCGSKTVLSGDGDGKGRREPKSGA